MASTRKAVNIFRYIITALGVITGIITIEDTPVEAQYSGCYYVNCYLHINYICRNHQPACQDCYNINGTYCLGPC
jgi:hypothetical protein